MGFAHLYPTLFWWYHGDAPHVCTGALHGWLSVYQAAQTAKGKSKW